MNFSSNFYYHPLPYSYFFHACVLFVGFGFANPLVAVMPLALALSWALRILTWYLASVGFHFPFEGADSSGQSRTLRRHKLATVGIVNLMVGLATPVLRSLRKAQ